MRSSFFLSLCLFYSASQAVNIVLSNDDGWAEINIRALYQSLTAADNSVLISGPALDKSGSGSFEGTPTTVTDGCEFNSCSKGSPPEGSDSSEPRFNYVNSYPVTAMKYGVQTLAGKIFGGPPDLVVSGFNVGGNTGLETIFSGTVGAASAAADQFGIPGLAFSGATGDQTGWNVQPVPDYVPLYADLSANFTNAVLASGTPYLPSNVWLNINFPAAGSGTSCTNVNQFKFVLSRIHTAIPILTPKDVSTCNNNGYLPTENNVVGTGGCYASVSVGRADNKLDASAADQAVVLSKLQSILTCLP